MESIPLGGLFGTMIILLICIPLFKSIVQNITFKNPVLSGFNLAAKGICLISYDDSLFGYKEYIANRTFHNPECINLLYGADRLLAKFQLRNKKLLNLGWK